MYNLWFIAAKLMQNQYFVGNIFLSINKENCGNLII